MTKEESLSIPNKLIAAMTREQLQQYLKQLKKMRKKFVWWYLNGMPAITPRTTAIMLAQERLRKDFEEWNSPTPSENRISGRS